MRNPKGYFISVDPDPGRGQPRITQHDTTPCIHCGFQLFAKRDKVERCFLCDDFICMKCAAKGGCDHIEKKLARIEAVNRYF
jgi:hypothetical protein